MKLKDNGNGIAVWISARETDDWATRPGHSWPCSELRGKRVFAEFDRNGLADLAVNGKDWDGDATEFNALVADHVGERARAYPSLSSYSAATMAEELCRIERAQRLHATRCCSGADGGYVRRTWETNCDGVPNCENTRHDPEAEERAAARIDKRIADWLRRLRLRCLLELRGGNAGDATVSIELQHDPRGRVLLIRLPGEAEPSTV